MNLDIPLPYHYKIYNWLIPVKIAFENGKEIWMTIHRRGGKDLFSLSEILLPEAFEHPGTYQYIWPSLKQGRDSFWEGKDEKGQDVMDYYIPQDMIVHKDNADMKLTVASVGGTSIIQVFGTNKGQYIALRGKPSNGAVFSEFAYQDPRGDEVISPMIRKTSGWRAYNSTPNGNNHHKQRYYLAKNNPNCFTILATVKDTYGHDGKRLVSEEAIQAERDDNKTEDYINQEYYCSFNQGIEGTYLGKQLQIAENDNRINDKILYEETLPVYTAWDLGVADFMSIIFYQLIGDEVRIIDYHEASGYSFVYYAQVLKDKGYFYGGHYAPHDIKVREMGSLNSKEKRALSRFEKAEKVGIKFEIIPMVTFENSTDNARAVMRRCYFKADNCRKLIAHLEQWGRKWNDIVQEYGDFEDHNVHSHAGASFRYMATMVMERTHSAKGQYAGWEAQQDAEALMKASNRGY